MLLRVCWGCSYMYGSCFFWQPVGCKWSVGSSEGNSWKIYMCRWRDSGNPNPQPKKEIPLSSWIGVNNWPHFMKSKKVIARSPRSWLRGFHGPYLSPACGVENHVPHWNRGGRSNKKKHVWTNRVKPKTYHVDYVVGYIRYVRYIYNTLYTFTDIPLSHHIAVLVGYIFGG